MLLISPLIIYEFNKFMDAKYFSESDNVSPSIVDLNLFLGIETSIISCTSCNSVLVIVHFQLPQCQ